MIVHKLTYLGTNGEPYSVQQLNKIIIKALPIVAMAKYVENSGDKLTSEIEVTQTIRQVDTYLVLQKKVQALKCEVARSKGADGRGTANGDTKAKGKGKGGSKSDSKPNPCKVHEGAHKWKDCQNNKYSSKFKGEKKEDQTKVGDKKKSEKKDLHATTANKRNSPPVITFKDDDSVISADFNLDLDVEGAMMLLEPDKSLHPVTVISMPHSKNEVVRAVTTMLLDQGFSGHVIVSYDFAIMLRYDLVPIEGKGSTY